MNRFLLLALTAGLLLPIAANAETWWMMEEHRAELIYLHTSKYIALI